MNERLHTITNDDGLAATSFTMDEMIKKDDETPDFYLKLTDPKTTEINYFSAKSLSDMVTISPINAFPSVIPMHFAAATAKTSFGCFPQIGRYYTTVDKKIFLWSTVESTSCESWAETNIITAVNVCGADPLYYPREIQYLLVVATATYIKIIEISNNKINKGKYTVVEVDFTPFCIASGPWGRIFIGGDSGAIHLLKFTDEGAKIISRIGLWSRIINNTIGITKPPIVQIAVDNTGCYIAALDEKNRISFFKFVYDSDRFYGFDTNYHGDEPIASLCPVVSNQIQNENKNFAAFCKNGNRIFFECNETDGCFSSGTYKLRAIRPPPPELNGQEVLKGMTAMGVTFLLCEKQILFLRGSRYTLFDFFEFVDLSPLPGNGIIAEMGNISVVTHNDPILWQHYAEAPIVFLLTAAGSNIITYSLPCQSLQKLIFPRNGGYSSEINDWLEEYDEIDEAEASALLLSDLYPEHSHWGLYIASEYSRNKFNSRPASLNLTGIIKGFYKRVARLISYFWYQPVLVKVQKKNGEDKWKVSPVFADIPQTTIIHLQGLIQLIKHYKKMRKTTLILTEVGLSDQLKIEIYQLKKLKRFISMILEMLKFIGILAQQKSSMITSVFNLIDADVSIKDVELIRLKENKLRRLDTQPFGAPSLTEDGNISLTDALREFSAVIFRRLEPTPELDAFATKIGKDCPVFVMNAESQLIQAIDDLEAVRLSQKDTQAMYLPRIVNVFLEYADKPYDIALVCEKLIQMNDPQDAISLVLKKSEITASTARALHWYKSGCDETDVVGAKAFNDIYEIYDATSDVLFSKNGLDAAVSTENELYHLFTYQKLLNSSFSSDVERLLNIKSKYIKSFLTENARTLLWRYLMINGDTDSAIKELCELATNSINVSIQTKIDWLTLACDYLKELHADKRLIESQALLECAYIHRELFGDDFESPRPLQNFTALLNEARQQNNTKMINKIIDTIHKYEHFDFSKP